MARVYVIQTGRTTWDEQSRVDSIPGAPLAPAGEQDVLAALGQLAEEAKFTAVYACEGQAEQQTAKLIAKQLGAKVRVRNDLRELDYGLWQGLTRTEIKRRQPKLFRQWHEDPASVRPPGGESLDEAEERLRQAVRDILRRHRGGAALLVLRPVVDGLLRCIVQADQPETLWKNVRPAGNWEPLKPPNDLLCES